MKFFLALIFCLCVFQQNAMSKYDLNVTGLEVCESSVKLYDFVEGANSSIHNFNMWERDNEISPLEYLNRAVEHLKNDLPWLAEKIDHHVAYARSKFYAVTFQSYYVRAKGKDIPAISNNCQYKDFSAWEFDFMMILINDMDLIDKLPSMDLAGLLLGKALYHMAATSKMYRTPEIEMRKLVAKAFSSEKFAEKDGEMLYSQKAINRFNMPICTDYILKRYKENVSEITTLLNSCPGNITTDHSKLSEKLDVHHFLIDSCKKYCGGLEQSEKTCEDLRLNVGEDIIRMCQ